MAKVNYGQLAGDHRCPDYPNANTDSLRGPRNGEQLVHPGMSGGRMTKVADGEMSLALSLRKDCASRDKRRSQERASGGASVA